MNATMTCYHNGYCPHAITHYVSSGYPEGLILLFIIFFIPFMITRANKVDFTKIIHEYMADTEKWISRDK